MDLVLLFLLFVVLPGVYLSPCVYISLSLVRITMATGWNVVWNCIEGNCDHTHVCKKVLG